MKIDNPHIRKVVNSIKEDIEQILENFIFEDSNYSTRIKIENMLNEYMSHRLAYGDLVDFKIEDVTNPFDDAGIVTFDTFIQPHRAIEITVLRTSMRSTGIEFEGFEREDDYDELFELIG